LIDHPLHLWPYAATTEANSDQPFVGLQFDDATAAANPPRRRIRIAHAPIEVERV
jgi:hypothetical protein